jgi:hypothetical protein
VAVFDAVDDAGRISRTLKEFINSRSIPMWAETLNDAKSGDRKTGRSKNGQTLQYRYALLAAIALMAIEQAPQEDFLARCSHNQLP